MPYIMDAIAEGPSYLCFTAEEANSTFYIQQGTITTPIPSKLYYSLDEKNWSILNFRHTITLSEVGDKVYIKGNYPEGFSSWQYPNQFHMSGKIAASGSVMSLIDGYGRLTTIPNENCFQNLFRDCRSLTSAPELPAKTLQHKCYDAMFSGCSSLISAPELPATVLAPACYGSMFMYCTNLIYVPKLPAMTLAIGCYSGMFAVCSSLTTLPKLSATPLYSSCYSSMFSDCEKIKLSSTQSEEYPNKYEFGETPDSGRALYMFTNTGGAFTGTPTQQIYYTSNEIIQ